MNLKQLISKFTIYQYMTAFLIILLLYTSLNPQYGFGIYSLIPVAIAVLTTSILDFFIEHFKTKEWRFPRCALISGLFIGGLLTQGLEWYVYMVAGIIAIASKHLIRFNQRNIFNPANLGILLVSIIFGAFHSWWISSPIILALIFGIFVIWRLRRFDLYLTFLISYYLINSIIELYMGSNFNDIYSTIINGGVIYFFAMYMLIEPKTNPTGKKQRIVYGVLVAVLLIVFSKFVPKHDILLALAVGNIFVPFLNKMKFEFGKKEN